MKNNLILLLSGLILSSATLFSYTIKIKNSTDSDMKIRIEYGGPGVCSPDTWALPAYGQIEKGVGGCCAKPGVKFRAETGSLRGQEVSYDPPRTGFGLSCRSWTAEARPLGNIFIVETR